MNKDKSKMWITIIIFLVLYYAVYFLFIKDNTQQQIAQPQEIEQNQEKSSKSENMENTDSNDKDSQKESENDINFNEETNKEEIVKVENKKYHLEFSTVGGKFTNYYFDKFGLTKENDLIIDDGKRQDIGALSTSFINVSQGTVKKDIDFKLSEESNKYIMEKTLLDANENRVLIRKIYEVSDDYQITLKIEINGLDGEIPTFNEDNYPALITWGSILGPINLKDSRYGRPKISYMKVGEFESKLKLKDGQMSELINFDWISVNNLHYSLVIQNNDISEVKAYATTFDKSSIDMYLTPKGISSINNSYDFKILMVYQDPDLLAAYNNEYKYLAKAGGILSPISLFFNNLLNFLNRVLGNFGLAIILLALIIKIALFPLSRKSIVSMKKMSGLSPELKKIQEQYKNDPQKQQKMTSELYKKAGVNPLAGCLPMLFQLPILFALIYGLSNNIYLNGSSFLWIQDLSSPDSIYKLGFSIPFIGNHVRLLPILMVVFTMIQSKLQSQNSAGNPDQQKSMKMMQYLMPFMFFFIFYNMPAGLVLYWTVQNILSIIENIIITKITPDDGKKLVESK